MFIFTVVSRTFDKLSVRPLVIKVYCAVVNMKIEPWLSVIESNLKRNLSVINYSLTRWSFGY
jgi:ABC-type transporter lipoprotein component MlaA